MNALLRFPLSGLCGLAIAAAACADPDEAAVVRAPLPPALRPLLALILDTSSVAPIAVREPYDPARDYGGAVPAGERCESSRVYWRRGAGPAPDCGLQPGLEPFPDDASRGLQCQSAREALDAAGFHIASRAAQWRPGVSGGDWTAPRADAIGAVVCRADAAVALDWDRSPFADPYIFYSGNFLNWLRSPDLPADRPFNAHAVASLVAALRAASELDVAWLRIAGDSADGGYVAGAPTAAAQAADQLATLATVSPAGGAPLAEALVESALWLAGGSARYGATVGADPRAFDAAGRYQSPISHACRPVTLAYLTAGLPVGDEEAGSAAAALPGFLADTGGCSGDCLPVIAQWLAGSDLRSDLPGAQSIAMRFLSVTPVPGLVASAAPPEHIGRIDDPLGVVNLIARSLQRDTAVPAPPRLSAAALLAAADPAHASDVVFALSAPRTTERWNGNLYRYALRRAASPLAPPTIIDRDGEDAIGADALPAPASRNAWSDAPDADLLAGGAAGRLPPPALRALYAEFGDPEITAPSNRLRAGNPALDAPLLGLGANDPESPEELIDWLTGQRHLGDPGPHAPAVAGYPDTGNQVVFAATHDGLLHAFDGASGVELWAWMPAPLLARFAGLMRNEPTTMRSHGIDGPLVLHRHDPDGDGHIDLASGEHLWLLFGLGRGGNRYYALDVSRVEAPRLLWSFALPGDARLESHAEPVVTRIRIDGADQNAGRWVVLLAGGYDRRFDAVQPASAGAANALLLIDAESGNLLWSSGGSPETDLAIPGFDASTPSAPRALDLDGDRLLDRAYAVDVAGGLWRFDFASGRAPAELAQARRIAGLGTGPQRFHATPDVSLARFAGGARLAVSVGSGSLARPLDASTVDRVYTLFDRIDGPAADTRVEADLHDADADAMPASAPGWYRRFDRHGAGEKVIGPAVTFDHALNVQTWQPLPPHSAAPCGPPRSLRRLYAFDVRNGRSHSVALESPEDEAIEIEGSSLPVALRFGFAESGIDCPGCRPRAFGIAGAETFDAGYAGDPVRTSWRKLAPPPPDSR